MYLMKCGHVANAKLQPSGNPICVICGGITEDAEIIVRECAGTEGLEGRKARCQYYGTRVGRNNETHYPSLMKNNCCGSEIPSEWELPFFKHQPDKQHDNFYCGCMGWD